MRESADARTKSSSIDHHRRSEFERVNARIRHFRGVAASVLTDAEKVWHEIHQACQDPRTCEEILDDAKNPTEIMPSCGWPELREKLHLLGHYIHYTKRLCDGSLDRTSSDE